MSLHKSWTSGGSKTGGNGGKVLKREERIALLKKNGTYSEDMYYNLPGGAAKGWEPTITQADRKRRLDAGESMESIIASRKAAAAAAIAADAAADAAESETKVESETAE